MAQGFLAIVGGKIKQVLAIVVSAGAGDSGKIPALGTDGKLDLSVMPSGVGAETVSATASEAIGAGKFVNFYDNAGTFSARLADNSNGREANGFARTAVGSGVIGNFYPMDSNNANLTGLTSGADYWLGTAGGVIATALDPVAEAGTNKISQYLGKAKGTTEIITTDSPPVIL